MRAEPGAFDRKNRVSEREIGQMIAKIKEYVIADLRCGEATSLRLVPGI
jgi:hypothetical protein